MNKFGSFLEFSKSVIGKNGILAHLSHRLKWLLIKICLLSVDVIVVVFVIVNLSHIILFPRTTLPILTKLGKKHHWIKKVHVCSNEGPRPVYNGEEIKILLHLKFVGVFQKYSLKPFGKKSSYLCGCIVGSFDLSFYYYYYYLLKSSSKKPFYQESSNLCESNLG